MITKTPPLPVDSSHVLALLERLDPTWRDTCSVEGCLHRMPAPIRIASGQTPARHRASHPKAA